MKIQLSGTIENDITILINISQMTHTFTYARACIQRWRSCVSLYSIINAFVRRQGLSEADKSVDSGFIADAYLDSVLRKPALAKIQPKQLRIEQLM